MRPQALIDREYYVESRTNKKEKEKKTKRNEKKTPLCRQRWQPGRRRRDGWWLVRHVSNTAHYNSEE